MAKKEKITFEKDLGIKEVSSKKGFCKVKLDLKPRHLNHGGIAHGGVLATLCDVALSGALATLMDKTQWCLTAQLNIDYISPAFPGEIFAYGKVVKKGNNLAFIEGGIESKDKKTITRAHGIWIIKNFPTKNIKPTRKMD